jgi:hypothetical protein
MSTATEIIKEFVDDIEAAYGETDVRFKEDWPDLVVTYGKAKKFLAAEEEGEMIPGSDRLTALPAPVDALQEAIFELEERTGFDTTNLKRVLEQARKDGL